MRNTDHTALAAHAKQNRAINEIAHELEIAAKCFTHAAVAATRGSIHNLADTYVYYSAQVKREIERIKAFDLERPKVSALNLLPAEMTQAERDEWIRTHDTITGHPI